MLYSLDIFLKSSELEKLNSEFEPIINLSLINSLSMVLLSLTLFNEEQAVKISKVWLAYINSQMKLIYILKNSQNILNRKKYLKKPTTTLELSELTHTFPDLSN